MENGEYKRLLVELMMDFLKFKEEQKEFNAKIESKIKEQEEIIEQLLDDYMENE